MEQLKKGDYGWFHFYTRSKGIKQGFSLYATVADMDKKYVHLIDNDGIEYLTRRTDIDQFTEAVKPELKQAS